LRRSCGRPTGAVWGNPRPPAAARRLRGRCGGGSAALVPGGSAGVVAAGRWPVVAAVGGAVAVAACGGSHLAGVGSGVDDPYRAFPGRVVGDVGRTAASGPVAESARAVEEGGGGEWGAVGRPAVGAA